jgi:hypothetical protein
VLRHVGCIGAQPQSSNPCEILTPIFHRHVYKHRPRQSPPCLRKANAKRLLALLALLLKELLGQAEDLLHLPLTAARNVRTRLPKVHGVVSLAVAPDLQGLCFPDIVVSLDASDECVGDLVQDDTTDLLVAYLWIGEKIPRDADALVSGLVPARPARVEALSIINVNSGSMPCLYMRSLAMLRRDDSTCVGLRPHATQDSVFQ